MRTPRVPNKYDLTPEKIRRLKTAKPWELKNPKYFWENQNYPWDGCILKGIDNHETADFFLRVGEEGVKEFRVTVMMLCAYNFTEFYKESEIENEYDLEIQELILKTVNRLIDDGILEICNERM